MPSFALYHIPDAETPFYQAGAGILGYDIWSGHMLQPGNPARAHFPTFNPDWPGDAQIYGFHMTITHALAFDAGQLPAIERETESNLNLFDPATLFTLQPTENWLFCDDHDVVLYYHPNPALLLFHVLCVARLHPYGTSTPFQQRFLHGELLELPLAKQHRAAQYLHPDVLESWFPHLALLRQHTGLSIAATQSAVLEALPPPAPITIQRVCLVIRQDHETHFRIQRVFDRADFPYPYSRVTS
jgi:hypothetical protein